MDLYQITKLLAQNNTKNIFITKFNDGIHLTMGFYTNPFIVIMSEFGLGNERTLNVLLITSTVSDVIFMRLLLFLPKMLHFRISKKTNNAIYLSFSFVRTFMTTLVRGERLFVNYFRKLCQLPGSCQNMCVTE